MRLREVQPRQEADKELLVQKLSHMEAILGDDIKSGALRLVQQLGLLEAGLADARSVINL